MNKQLIMLIPLILFVASLFIIFQQINNTGFFIQRDISLKGGTVITIQSQSSAQELEQYINSKVDYQINVRTINDKGKQAGLVIEAEATDKEQVDELLKLIDSKVGLGDYSLEQTGASLGAGFFKQTIKALIYTFILMAIVVFVYFKKPVPSLAVVFAALGDMITTIAILNILNIKLSTAGIAAFLMLIGYSVDTDILLTTRVLKMKEGTLDKRIKDAFKTGMTMTGTTLAVVLAALLLSSTAIISQIMLILLIGLLIDIINTWLFNAPLLRWYVSK